MKKQKETGRMISQPARAWRTAAPEVDSLAGLRRAVGMSQEALGRALDVSRGLIAKIEGGAAPVTEKMARRIARVFSVKVPTGRAYRLSLPPRSGSGGTPGPAADVLKEWTRRVEVGVSIRGPVGDAGWRTLLTVLGEMHKALPNAKGFQASFDVVEPEGAAPGAVGKTLLLSLGKTQGLDARPPGAADDADLVIGVPEERDTVIRLRWRSQGSRNADAEYRARLADRERIYRRKARR